MTEIDLDGMGVDELVDLRDRVAVKLGQAFAVLTAPAKAMAEVERHDVTLDEIAASWHEAHGGTGTQDDPTPWVAPSGPSAHDAWPRDSWVTHGGQVWHNPHPVNRTEPSTPGSRWVHEEDV